MNQTDPGHPPQLSQSGETKVALALAGKLSISGLAGHEQEVYFDKLEELQGRPSPIAEAFFVDRRKRGVGVGLDDNGMLVWQAPELDGYDVSEQ